jgi:prophage regulatory protein
MANQLRTALTILRRRQIEAESGYSRSTLYLRIAQGLWTKQVSLGARAVGWPAAEVDALNAARIAGKTDGEIRALVLRLEAARAAAQPDSIFAKSI